MIKKEDINFEFRGGNSSFMCDVTSREKVLVGCAGSGKSLASLTFLIYWLSTHPGSRALILRKTRSSLTESGLVTLERDVLQGQVSQHFNNVARTHRHSYRFKHNGSELVTGGMDNPVKIFSTDYDLIYCQEAVELTEDEWESLLRALRNGKLPFQQLLGDTNPSYPTHWLKQRCSGKDAKTKMYTSTHKDNPAFFQDGQWTHRGQEYLGMLHGLSGVRRKRLLEGAWVAAEGQIFEEWSEETHVIRWDDMPIPDEYKKRSMIPPYWPHYISIDFGMVEPFVVQWAAADEDGRLYIYREMVQTGKLVEDHAREIKASMEADETVPQAIFCDHDLEGRLTLEKYLGVKTRPAYKDIMAGIDAVSARLRKGQDGKPRLYILRDALVRRDARLTEKHLPCGLIEEIPGYVWLDSKTKECPLQENDHSCDCTRMLVGSLDRAKRKIAVRIF